MICRHYSSLWGSWNNSGLDALTNTSSDRTANSASTMFFEDTFSAKALLVMAIGETSETARTPFCATREMNFLSAQVLEMTEEMFASIKTDHVSEIFLPSGTLSWF